MALAPQTAGVLPRHVAIIMDGNGRWARKRLLPREAGHVAGMSAVREVVRAASDIGLANLTLFAFSLGELEAAENRSGSADGFVSRLFPQRSWTSWWSAACGCASSATGRASRPTSSGMIEDAEKRTAHNTGLNLTFAFDYGGQEEIADAARELAAPQRKAASIPRRSRRSCSPRAFSPAPCPSPISSFVPAASSGLTNFLLWQSAYAEFVFVETLWPDFGRREVPRMRLRNMPSANGVSAQFRKRSLDQGGRHRCAVRQCTRNRET